VVDAKKRDLEAKRAVNASKGVKTFFKVTVKVRLAFLLLAVISGSLPIWPTCCLSGSTPYYPRHDCISLFVLQDNGVGMPHADIPNLLGRVLSGTKYGVQQTRGKFGLGAKMALIWSKMSTGLPIDVRSARKGQISYYKLDIDIHKYGPYFLQCLLHSLFWTPTVAKQL
jgi:hypothetical protein